MNTLLLSTNCMDGPHGADTSSAQLCCSVVFSQLSDILGVSISSCGSGVSDLVSGSDVNGSIGTSS